MEVGDGARRRRRGCNYRRIRGSKRPEPPPTFSRAGAAAARRGGTVGWGTGGGIGISRRGARRGTRGAVRGEGRCDTSRERRSKHDEFLPRSERGFVGQARYIWPGSIYMGRLDVCIWAGSMHMDMLDVWVGRDDWTCRDASARGAASAGHVVTWLGVRGMAWLPGARTARKLVVARHTSC